MCQSRAKRRRTRLGVLTTELGKHLRVGDHMLQTQRMLLRNVVEIQKPRLRQSLLQELLTGLARGVRHVPTCVHENRVLGDVRGVHEERRDILSGERPCRDGGVQEWPGCESTAIWEENLDHGFWRSVADNDDTPGNGLYTRFPQDPMIGT